jgi:laminin gamma 1
MCCFSDLGLLSSVHLGSASLAPSDPNAPEAQWVESCECLQGFVGQFCESCAPGYRRELKFGGAFNRCVKCDCHGHSDSCDAESGEKRIVFSLLKYFD